MECVERKIFTTQFHPEVKHSEYGQQLLSNFLFEICGLKPNWSMDNLVETMTAEFREKVGDDRVILPCPAASTPPSWLRWAPARGQADDLCVHQPRSAAQG